MHLGEFDRSGRRAPTADDRDKPMELPADQIILAIGQRLDAVGIFGNKGPEIDPRGFIAADPVTGATSLTNVFAGGDAVEGPSSVVMAIGAGERAAVGMDLLLNGGTDRAFWRWEQENDTLYDPDAKTRDALSLPTAGASPALHCSGGVAGRYNCRRYRGTDCRALHIAAGCRVHRAPGW